MKLSFSFLIGKYRPYFSLRLGIIPNPRVRTIGLTNRTKDLHFIPYLEYDYVELEIVELECGALQSLFPLSDFHILQCSEDSFHTVCYDKLTLDELVHVLQYPSIDFNFRRGALSDKSRCWVLRDMPKGKRDKPTYIKTVESSNREYKQSEAHAIFFNEHYGIPLKYLHNPDGIKDFLIAESYKTGSRLG